MSLPRVMPRFANSMSNAKRFLVWGAGGHGKVVADLARSLGQIVVGYIDGDPAKLGQRADGSGSEVVLAESAFMGVIEAGEANFAEFADGVLLGIGNNSVRLRCLDWLQGRLRNVPSLVHPHATVSGSVALGDGTVVLAGAVINTDARVGRAVLVNTAAVVEHDCILEDGVHVSPGAVLTGGVRAETLSWIGAGAQVLNAVSIGARASVGAGAVVTRDVACDTTVVGVPARQLRRKRR